MDLLQDFCIICHRIQWKNQLTIQQGKIDELQAKYQVIADEINAGRDKTEPDVNMNFVMNESFSDPLELDGLNLGMDPIPFNQGSG